MNKDIKELLDEEISDDLNAISSMAIASDEYKNAVDTISKLIDKRNEIDKIELEMAKHELSKQKENELNDYNKKDRWINHAISIGSILVPVLLTVWGTYKTLKFEETGTVTTIMGRGFVNKLIPKK